MVGEAACTLGAIPAVMPYAETHHPPSTRLQAASFLASMCSASQQTLHMLVACSGLRALAKLLVQPASPPELLQRAIDAIKAVLGMRSRAPRGDLCRTFARHGVLELLVSAIPK